MLQDIVNFWVAGIPQPGGSKKHIGRGRIVDANPRAAAWKAIVKEAAEVAMNSRPPLEGPVVLRMYFTLPRPKSHYRTGKFSELLKEVAPKDHVVAPDATKLVRPTEDAMTGVVYKDDSQVVGQWAQKNYGSFTGVWITVTPLW